MIRQPRPHIRYFGSKWRIAEWIVGSLPEHTCYVEVFGGSGAVLLSKRPAATDVYNDLDGDVVHLFRVMREHGEALARAVALTPYSREEHALSFEPTPDPLERARRFVVRSWQTRGGYRRTGRSSWWYQRGIGRCNAPALTWTRVPDRLSIVAERLARVHIECVDWREIIRRYDAPDTLFYADPPYLQTTRVARYEYSHEMAEADHVELLDALAQVEGLVVLSGYPSQLYDDALSEWQCLTTTSRAQAGGTRTECLWLSPNAVRRGVQGDLWR